MRQQLVERPMPTETPACGPSRRTVSLNLAESPLSWLRARGLVSDRQYAGGELLRRDYETAQLGPKITMRWEATPPGRGTRGSADPAYATTGHLVAKQRFDGAIKALGPGLNDISWRVLCACDAMVEAEKNLGWPARSGRLVLTLALDRLADYYRLP